MKLNDGPDLGLRAGNTRGNEARQLSPRVGDRCDLDRSFDAHLIAHGLRTAERTTLHIRCSRRNSGTSGQRVRAVVTVAAEEKQAAMSLASELQEVQDLSYAELRSRLKTLKLSNTG